MAHYASPAPRSVTYTLSEDAFMAACHQLWAHRAIGRVGNRIVAAFVLACAGFLIWQNVPGMWPWLLLMAGVVFIVLDAMRDRLWRGHYRSLVKYTAPITATFTDAGIDFVSAEADARVSWSQFRHFAITRDYLFLLIDQRSFSVIPLAAFSDPSSRLASESLIARNLKPLKSRLF